MPLDRHKLRWNGWGWRDHPDDLSGREDVWAWLAGELRMPALLLTPALPLEDARLPPSQLTEQDRRVLARVVGAEHFRDDMYERAFHARGRSYHDLLRLRAGDLSDAPDAVVCPATTEQVLMLLAYASERGVAVVPYGGGTSVVGGVTGQSGGDRPSITIDLSRMHRVEHIDPDSQLVRAQAGICGPALEKALAEHRLTLGHFPQSFEFSTLGGWIAHRGAGQQSNRAGKAEDWLVAAELATPRGILREPVVPASAAGPQLTDLIAGSEGAFGIITSATVRVHSQAEAATGRAWLFRHFESGAAAIRDAVQNGVPATMLRLSDAEETRFQRTFSQIGHRRSLVDRAFAVLLNARRYTAACLLIARFEGSQDRVRWSKSAFSRIARAHGGFPLGRTPTERWQQSRFSTPYLRDPMLDRGVGIDTLETATTWSNLATLYRAVQSALETAIGQTGPRAGARGIVMCHVSHSYPDGASLYFTFIFPRALDDEIAQWQAIKHAASQAIVANGGTISHHHGVGQDHLPWMAQEKGALGIDVLRAVKRSLDPKNILNPGKLIP